MQRGEVRWYRFERPDKKRTVLILTRDSALGFLGDVTVAPITPRSAIFRPKSSSQVQMECRANVPSTWTTCRPYPKPESDN